MTRSDSYDALALHASERARTRSLVELLSEANANIRQGVDPKLLEQERTRQQQLNDFEHRKYQLQSSQYGEQELNEIKQKIDTVLAQLDQLEAQIRVTSPRYADLKYPDPLTLQQIQQQVLDDDTLLLQYSLGKDRSYLWAVTKNSITSYELPKRTEIEAAAQTFRESVTQDSGTNLDAGVPLSQMLLAPVANQLGNKRLLIVGDGALQYVPFAALPVPSSLTTPLLVQNEIVTLPSISTVAIQRRQLQNRFITGQRLRCRETGNKSKWRKRSHLPEAISNRSRLYDNSQGKFNVHGAYSARSLMQQSSQHPAVTGETVRPPRWFGSQPNVVSGAIGVSALIFFACSSVRHALFQSSAYDLGWFDQAIYLISQGQPPIVSFYGIHVLGGHAEWIVYLLAGLYKIVPDVHWLFAVQAVALSLGALPTFHLARQAGLKESQAIAMALVYLLYPLVFNLNLFDFHPEVIALPAFLGAVLAARKGRVGWFSAAVILILGCKAVLALTVAAMGLWLWAFEKRRWCGAIAFVAGVAWFAIAVEFVIPSFIGTGPIAVSRYAYLGDSVGEIALNLFLKPGLILGRIFSLATLGYLVLLILPVLWGLSLRYLTPLIVAIPTLVINILSDSPAQRDLVHQYSLPILPFLLLAVISSLAAVKGWMQRRRGIILWSVVAFIALAKYGYFWSIYLESLDTWQATRGAIAQIQTKGGVLVPPQVAPHLTHRPIVELTIAGSEAADLSKFDYVMLDLRRPGFGSSPEVVAELLQRLQNASAFQLAFEQDEIYLFVRQSAIDNNPDEGQ